MKQDCRLRRGSHLERLKKRVAQITTGSKRLLVASIFAFSASASWGQTSFVDVATPAGVDLAVESYGASIGDFNGDGLLDIFANNHRERPSLYMNLGNGTFYDTGKEVREWIYHANGDTHGGSFADFDNDGDLDLLISLGTGNPSQMLVNDYGAYIDMSSELGVAFPNLGGRLPMWFDYNNDNLIDFVMTQFGGAAKLFTQNSSGFVENTTTVKLLCLRFHYGHLYDTNGDGALDFMCHDTPVFPQKVYNTVPLPWTNITTSFPPVNQVVDSIIADFNNDQRMDMFLVSNVQLRPSNVVAANPTTLEASLAGGQKGFNFVTPGTLTVDLDWNRLDLGFTAGIRIGSTEYNPPSVPFTLDPANPNNHGLPASDPGAAPIMRIGFNPATSRWTFIFQTEGLFGESYYTVTSTQAISDLNSTGLWGTDKTGSPTMMMNYPGGFTDDTTFANLTAPIQCVSATAGDFDNDMDVDLYLACRSGVENLPNIYYDNQGDGTFLPVANAGGAIGNVGVNITDGVGTADVVLAADFNVDGFLDLFVTNGLGLRPKVFGGPGNLFENQGNGNHWVQLDLVGTSSTTDPIGARVYATTLGGFVQTRVVDGGYHRWSQETSRLHFGLANNTTVDLEVHWPNGGVEQFAGVAADALYRIVEGAGTPQVVVPGQGPAYSCGKPNYNLGTDEAVIIWRDCINDEWKFRFSPGGVQHVYTGSLIATQEFDFVQELSIESSDVFDTSNPTEIIFELSVNNSAQDGFNLKLGAGSQACFDVASPGTTVYYGPLRTQLTAPFNLLTGLSCGDLPLTISGAGETVLEGAGNADFELTLSEASVDPVSVTVQTEDGSAIAGQDYVAQGPTTVIFSPGQTVSTFSVPILDDAIGENAETFSLLLSDAVGAGIAASSISATIIDDDQIGCGEPSFSPGSEAGVFVWQNCGTGQWFARMTAGGPSLVTYIGEIFSGQPFSQVSGFSLEGADRLDATTDPQAIVYNLRMLNAGVDGIDFTPAAGADVCFGVDQPVGTTAFVGLAKTPVSTPFNLANLGNCDFVVPTVSVEPLSVSETAGSANVNVRLSLASSNTVMVDFSTSDGTATAGLDYTAVATTTVTFPAGQTLQTVPVTINDDTEEEGSESFTVTLSNPIDATLGTSSATVTIEDDDTVSVCGEPTISAGTESGVFVWRDCGTENWHLRVAGGSVYTRYFGEVSSSASFPSVTGFSLEASDSLTTTAAPALIDFQLNVGGAGQDGVDFTTGIGASSCVTINAPATTSVYVGAAKSPVPTEFNLATLGPCQGGTPLVGVFGGTALESAGTASVTVSLSETSASAVSVDISTVEGSATGDVDYISVTNAPVTIPAGQLSTTFDISLIDDSLSEGNETLTVQISNVSGALLGSESSLLTITDDEVSSCGQPSYNPGTEPGVWLWQECGGANDGNWHMRVTGAGDYTTYAGSIESTAAFDAVAGFSIEAADVLNLSDPAAAVFQLKVGGAGQDGIDFRPAPASATCFGVSAPPNLDIFVGVDRLRVTPPFSLESFGPC